MDDGAWRAQELPARPSAEPLLELLIDWVATFASSDNATWVARMCEIRDRTVAELQRRGRFHMCGRCYAINVPLLPETCDGEPEYNKDKEAPCPLCGAVRVAGLPHPKICHSCRQDDMA